MLKLDRLLELMAQLRHPEQGCPWDVAQGFETIAPYTLEEAYEVVDAIERGNLDDLRRELGDLLLQVVFHARIAQEKGAFDFGDVVDAISAKLIRRHPHVFDSEGRPLGLPTQTLSSADVEANWEARKSEERQEMTSPGSGDAPLLGNVAQALPALVRAAKVSRYAASHGFDWPDAVSVIGKVREEVDEVAEALASGDEAALSEEIGDLLFSVSNLARHAGINPEAALRDGTRKFERRFTAMAQHLAGENGGFPGSDLAAMESAWAAVKRAERAGS